MIKAFDSNRRGARAGAGERPTVGDYSAVCYYLAAATNLLSGAISVLLILLIAAAAQAQVQKTRQEKVSEDRARVEADGFWIYNDLPLAFATAKQTGKPMLVVLRCIPCEECVKLDDELVEKDPIIRPLLDNFVCVRQVSTNGLDLSLFQFDTDQSFAVFMLNADGTIYGRFGTRSHRTEWEGDVSLTGMAKALQGALDLHAQHPSVKDSLAGKRGSQLEAGSPEQYPSLKDRYIAQWDHSGNAVASCIHCHQIGDARRDFYRRSGKPIPDRILFPYPHPKVIGLTLDPEEMATVKSVEPASVAAQAGFRAGDQIRRLNGQPLLSIADVQWVLDGVPPQGGQVIADVTRGRESMQLAITLSDGWRRRGDISWRTSTWGLRRMVTGGLSLESLPQEARDKLQIPRGAMALRVKTVGQFGAHGAAKRAGFQQGDVIVEFDGQRDLMQEADLLRHGVTERRAGDEVSVTVRRDGGEVKLTLPMQS
jgi:hypothetical protein